MLPAVLSTVLIGLATAHPGAAITSTICHAACRPAPSVSRSWSATLDLRIDATLNDLTPITFVSVDAAGKIAVGQFQDFMVRFFDERGKPAGTFGRRGAGPGEFESIGEAGLIGGRLWVADNQLSRVTLILNDHKTFTSFRLPTGVQARPAPLVAAHALWGLTPDGDLLIAISGFGLQQPPEWARWLGDTSLVVVRTDSTGLIRRVITRIPRSRCALLVGGTWISIDAAGMCRPPLRHIAADGTRIAILESLNFNPTGAATFRVTVVSQKGDTAYSRTYPAPPLPISARVADSIRQARTSEFMNATPARRSEADAWRTVHLPAQFAPAWRIVAGRDGTTWVGMRAIGKSRTWLALDRAGTQLGSVTLPATVEVLEAERGVLWGTDEGDDGLQSIIRYKVGN